MSLDRIRRRRHSLTWSHDFRASWLKTNGASAGCRGANSQTSGSGPAASRGFRPERPAGARIGLNGGKKRPYSADFALYGLVKSVDKTRLQLLGCS
jgi:hypothetical protein